VVTGRCKTAAQVFLNSIVIVDENNNQKDESKKE